MTNNDDLEKTIEEESFADLLEQSLSEQSGMLRPGQNCSPCMVTQTWYPR